jgi:hypothetical protein
LSSQRTSKGGPKVGFLPNDYGLGLVRLGIGDRLGNVVNILNFEIFSQVQRWLTLFNTEIAFLASRNFCIS